MIERLYSIPAAAQRLAVSRSTVYRLIRAGRLDVIRLEGSSVSKRIRVPESAIQKFISRQEQVAS